MFHGASSISHDDEHRCNCKARQFTPGVMRFTRIVFAAGAAAMRAALTTRRLLTLKPPGRITGLEQMLASVAPSALSIIVSVAREFR